ncbi:MAG: hypothetical protein R2759_21080 [Bacteroidales bacterium]
MILKAFKNDTAYFEGTGKVTDEVLGRASEAYLQWNLKNFSFFLGRLGRNFGINNEPGLLLSNNPFSYDHLALKFSNKVLNFTFLLTRMNDLYGYDIRDSVPVYSWNRRFLSVHRLKSLCCKTWKLPSVRAFCLAGRIKVSDSNTLILLTLSFF